MTKYMSSKCNGKFCKEELMWDETRMLLIVTGFKILKIELKTQ